MYKYKLGKLVIFKYNPEKPKVAPDYKFANTSGIDTFITNYNVTKNGIPIPILLKNGHGTGTGGYVAPNDFITPVVDIVVKDVSSLIERKLR